ncbi:MAG: hypothetical protein JNL70_04050 [Saprospiraceae bacterium]|nr:hypothetical protein [Saprospiraceae bacterium]
MKTKKNFLLIISFSLVICPLLAQFDVRQSSPKTKVQQTQPQPNVILQQTQQPKPSLPKEEAVLKETKNSSVNKTTQSSGNQETIKLNTKQSGATVLEGLRNPPPEKKKGGVFILPNILLNAQTHHDMDDIYGIINLEITKMVNGKQIPIDGAERKDIYFNDCKTRCLTLCTNIPLGLNSCSPFTLDFNGEGIVVNIKPEDIETAEVHIGFYLIDKDANVDWAKGDGDDDIFTFLDANQAHGRYVYPNNWSVYHFPLSKATGKPVKLELGNGTDVLAVTLAPIFKLK